MYPSTTKNFCSAYIRGVICGWTFLGLLAVNPPACAKPPLSEVLALQGFAANTGIDNWTDHGGWSFDIFADPCGTSGNDWVGVYCSGDMSHIVKILLDGNNLSGSIPVDTFQAFPNLEVVRIAENHLSGNLPALAGLSALNFFDAHHNAFSGSIPALDRLPQLQSFLVGENQLSGRLPCLSPMRCPDAPPNLIVFNADINGLTGEIGSLDGSQLQIFSVRHNLLSGNLPPLHLATNLLSIDVSMTELSGLVLDAPPSLLANNSYLCPTNLGAQLQPSSVQHAWNLATGARPWYRDCGTKDEIFTDSFD